MLRARSEECKFFSLFSVIYSSINSEAPAEEAQDASDTDSHWLGLPKINYAEGKTRLMKGDTR
jgi:hypothetical protein